MKLQNLDVMSGFGQVDSRESAVGDQGRTDLLWDRHGKKKRYYLREEEFEPKR